RLPSVSSRHAEHAGGILDLAVRAANDDVIEPAGPGDPPTLDIGRRRFPGALLEFGDAPAREVLAVAVTELQDLADPSPALHAGRLLLIADAGRIERGGGRMAPEVVAIDPHEGAAQRLDHL